MRKWLMRNRTEIGLYFGYTVLCALFLLKGDRLPSVFPEETGYLGWAYRLLGEEGSGLYFLPGYSLFLVPFLAICRDITVIYPYLLCVNLLLNQFLIVGLYRLAGIWGITGKRQILTAAIVSLYAPFVLYTQKAICETLLISCGVWLTVFLHGAVEGNKRNWIGVIGIGFLMLITHSRAFVLVPVFLLFLLLCYSHKKEIKVGAGIVLLAGLACLFFVFTDSGITSVHLKNNL